MENPIPSISKGAQGQKKQKIKGSVKAAQSSQSNPQPACASVQAAQAQQSGQSKPQAV